MCREVGGVNLGLVAGPRENPRMKGCSSVILDPHNEGNLRDEGALTAREQGFPHGIVHTRAVNFL